MYEIQNMKTIGSFCEFKYKITFAYHGDSIWNIYQIWLDSRHGTLVWILFSDWNLDD